MAGEVRGAGWAADGAADLAADWVAPEGNPTRVRIASRTAAVSGSTQHRRDGSHRRPGRVRIRAARSGSYGDVSSNFPLAGSFVIVIGGRVRSSIRKE
jgi:hypothetical protein